MTDNQPKITTQLILACTIAIVTAAATAYFSVDFWGHKLEEAKVRLSFEEAISIRQIETTDKVIFKAVSVFQHAPLNKTNKLINEALDTTDPINKKIIHQLKKVNPKPKIDDTKVFELYLDFQISLLASKPYIDKYVFEELLKYSYLLNDFIHHSKLSNKDALSIYSKAATHLNNAMNRVRGMYKYESIATSILDIAKE